jgi:hypothetical protein
MDGEPGAATLVVSTAPVLVTPVGGLGSSWESLQSIAIRAAT